MNTLMNVMSGNIKLSRKAKICLAIAAAVLIGIIAYTLPTAFAEARAQDVMALIINVMKKICVIVGAIFALIGIVKIAIAHANEDGPAQQKAAMMLATGVILVILGTTTMLDIVKNWV